MFGENVKHLNIIDCFYETGKGCEDITATPTWKFGNKEVVGKQSIEMIKDLSKC